jgi:hypothetical protein
MVFSLEHDIKVTKNHKNVLPTQTVIVTHRVVLSTVSFAYLKSELNWISSHKIISSVASKTVTEISLRMSSKHVQSLDISVGTMLIAYPRAEALPFSIIRVPYCVCMGQCSMCYLIFTKTNFLNNIHY